MPFHYPGPEVAQDFGPAGGRGHEPGSIRPECGFAVRRSWPTSAVARACSLRLAAAGAGGLARPGLVRDQVHFLGNYSLAIIAVSGLFVGFVLALQGYYTCSASARRRPWA